MTKLLKVALAAGVGALAACGGTGGGMEEAAPAADEITIVFENNQPDDVIVYYTSTSGVNRRLGRVPGHSTGQFRARTAPTGFTIVADFDTLGDDESATIYADPGDIVTVTAMATGGIIHTVSR